MIQSDITFGLGVKGADAAVALLRRFGFTATQEIGKINKAAAPATKGLQRMDGATKGASVTFKNLAASIQLVDGPLGGVASRFTVLSAAIGRVGIVGAGVLLTTTALTTGWIATAKAAGVAERNIFRIDAVLRATGHAAGITRREINDFAGQLGRDTLTSRNAVREAAAALLSFRSISEDTFFRTLTAAQDLSATFGGDLRSNTVLLARALEDPIRGLDSLRRKGVVFSATQQDLIQSLAASGQQLEAQGLILDAVAGKVGGAGAGESEGLIGKVDTLGESWGDMLEALGNTGPIIAAVEELTGLFRIVEKLAGGGNLEEQLAFQKSLLDSPGLRATAFLANPFAASAAGLSESDITARIAELKAEIQARDQADLLEANQASEGLATARREAVQNKLLELEKKFTDAFLSLTENRAQKLREAAEKEIAILEGLRGPETNDRVDSLIAKRQDLLAKQIAQLPKASSETDRLAKANQKVVDGLQLQVDLLGKSKAKIAEETAVRRLNAQAIPAQVAKVRELSRALTEGQNREADNKIVANLEREIAALRLSARERSVATALRRVSATATETEKNRVRALAGALFDQAQAQEAVKGITEGLRTPQERYNIALAKAIELQRLYAETGGQAGLSADLFRRQQEALGRELVRSDETLRGIAELGRGFTGTLTDWKNGAITATEALTGLQDRLFQILDRLLIEQPLNNFFEGLLVPSANGNLSLSPPPIPGSGAGGGTSNFGVGTDPSQVAFSAAAQSVGLLNSAAGAAAKGLGTDLVGGVAQSVAAAAGEQAATQAASSGLATLATSAFQASAALTALAASGGGAGGGFGVQGIGSAISMIPARAQGGPLRGLGLVGEEGPELFRPDEPGTIVPARETARILERMAASSGGGGNSVTINGPLATVRVRGGRGGHDRSDDFNQREVQMTTDQVMQMAVEQLVPRLFPR